MGPLTCGPLLSVAVGALDQVHLAAELDLKFDFSLFSIPDFVANFKNPYLEIGVSTLSELFFVGFIMKFTI